MDELLEVARECAEAWGLELEEPFPSLHSLVVPAGDAVLKLNVTWHFEAEHEADALAAWGGKGAVRLLARDDERRALLVERCRPGTHLGHHAIDEVLELLPRLSVDADGPFRLLADEADRWLEELPGRGYPAELVDYALDVLRSVDRAARHLVNQDLHGENLLAAEREPWLVIDPKPLLGERELDAVGPLRNASDPARWLDALAGLGLDRERMRGWASRMRSPGTTRRRRS